ncbi:MAG: hypothetical protein HY856_13315 [Burkholderiales bacterium]|nr:hypothetical protein [Burkholderiales bacterium]
MTTNDNNPDRFIMRDELAKALGGVCSETMRRWLKAKKLPPPDVALSRKTKGWRLSTLRAAGINLA